MLKLNRLIILIGQTVIFSLGITLQLASITKFFSIILATFLECNTMKFPYQLPTLSHVIFVPLILYSFMVHFGIFYFQLLSQFIFQKNFLLS